MLLEFRVRNFKSIRELESFSMLPSKSNKYENISILKSNNHLAVPTAAIFGRNGAGKSNLLEAMSRLQEMVLYGGKLEEGAEILYEPYKLNPDFQNQPTYFAIEFVANDKVKYVYEVEFNKSEILSEILNFYPKGQKAKLFERRFLNISFGESFTGSKASIEQLLYKNQLLLSKVKGDNIEPLKTPYYFFSHTVFFKRPGELSNSSYIAHFARNAYHSKYPKYLENISRLMRAADTGIVDLSVEKRNIEAIKMPEFFDAELRRRIEQDLEYYIITKHKSEIGNSEELVIFSIFDESMGTRRLLEIGGLILEALHDGQVLIIDEFDLSLHPLLTKTLIKLFNSPKTNPHNSQLIISTQDISLLDLNVFTFDQLWIVEKSHEGSSNYYALSDMKGLRKNIPIDKWYIDGRLGGLPVINYSELEFEI
jgi:uncharacterized protein